MRTSETNRVPVSIPWEKRLNEAYTEILHGSGAKKSKPGELLSWCLKTAEKRIETIVRGQHRRSYDKAAELAVACAEVLQARADEKENESWLKRIADRFPRHRAFQSELQKAMRNGSL